MSKKTFKLFTFSQIITVKNCTDMADALVKADLRFSEVWNIEEVKDGN